MATVMALLVLAIVSLIAFMAFLILRKRNNDRMKM